MQIGILLALTAHRPVRPPTIERARLADEAGSWAWSLSGAYGLSDSSGSWVWSDSPNYALNHMTLEWETV